MESENEEKQTKRESQGRKKEESMGWKMKVDSLLLLNAWWMDGWMDEMREDLIFTVMNRAGYCFKKLGYQYEYKYS